MEYNEFITVIQILKLIEAGENEVDLYEEEIDKLIEHGFVEEFYIGEDSDIRLTDKGKRWI